MVRASAGLNVPVLARIFVGMTEVSGGRLLGVVSGKAIEDIARAVMDDFRSVDPEEYGKWSTMMKFRREQMLDQKGFTKERELMAVTSVPLYVDLMIGRMTGDRDWRLDWKNMEAFVRACPECRINTTTGMRCSGD